MPDLVTSFDYLKERQAAFKKYGSFSRKPGLPSRNPGCFQESQVVFKKHRLFSRNRLISRKQGFLQKLRLFPETQGPSRNPRCLPETRLPTRNPGSVQENQAAFKKPRLFCRNPGFLQETQVAMQKSRLPSKDQAFLEFLSHFIQQDTSEDVHFQLLPAYCNPPYLLSGFLPIPRLLLPPSTPDWRVLELAKKKTIWGQDSCDYRLFEIEIICNFFRNHFYVYIWNL